MLHARLTEIEDRITAIDEQIANLQNERIGLVDEQETLRQQCSADVEHAKAQMTVLMKSVGMTDEAIEVALAAQFGSKPALFMVVEDKPKRKRTTLEDLMKSVCDALTTTPQLSKDIRHATGLEKHQVLRALHELIKQGVIETAGATNSAKYWLKGEAQ